MMIGSSSWVVGRIKVRPEGRALLGRKLLDRTLLGRTLLGRALLGRARGEGWTAAFIFSLFHPEPSVHSDKTSKGNVFSGYFLLAMLWGGGVGTEALCSTCVTDSPFVGGRTVVGARRSRPPSERDHPLHIVLRLMLFASQALAVFEKSEIRSGRSDRVVRGCVRTSRLPSPVPSGPASASGSATRPPRLRLVSLAQSMLYVCIHCIYALY